MHDAIRSRLAPAGRGSLASRAREFAAPAARAAQAAARSARPRCLLATRHAETGLLGALRRVLARELPSIEFVLDAGSTPLDAVWVCGYDPADGGLVRELRGRHPAARLLVTRCGGDGWGPGALASGADAAAAWPMPLGELERLLRPARAG